MAELSAIRDSSTTFGDVETHVLTGTLTLSDTLEIDVTKNIVHKTGLINMLPGANLIVKGNFDDNSELASGGIGLLVDGGNLGGGSVGTCIRFTSATNQSNPANLVIENATIKVYVDETWAAIGHQDGVSIQAKLKTQGKFASILSLQPPSTAVKRIRTVSLNPFLDLQAEKTITNLWLNLGVSQHSLKGLTPVGVDGPEVNVDSIATASKITFENYDPSYVVGIYYPNNDMILYQSPYVDLTNVAIGTNIRIKVMNNATGKEGVVLFSRNIKITVVDLATTNPIVGAEVFIERHGNSLTVNPKGNTSHVIDNQYFSVLTNVNGEATGNYIYAVLHSNINIDATKAVDSGKIDYFCSNTTGGSESETGHVRHYSYKEQTVEVSFAGFNEFEHKFFLSEDSGVTKTKADAELINGITITKPNLITVTSNVSLEDIYDYFKTWFIATSNMDITEKLVVENDTLIFGNYILTMDSGSGFVNGSGKITKFNVNQSSADFNGLSSMEASFDYGGTFNNMPREITNSSFGNSESIIFNFSGSGDININASRNGTGSITLASTTPSNVYLSGGVSESDFIDLNNNLSFIYQVDILYSDPQTEIGDVINVYDGYIDESTKGTIVKSVTTTTNADQTLDIEYTISQTNFIVVHYRGSSNRVLKSIEFNPQTDHDLRTNLEIVIDGVNTIENNLEKIDNILNRQVIV